MIDTKGSAHSALEVSVKLTRVDIEQKNPHPWKGVIFVAQGVGPGRDKPWELMQKNLKPRMGRHIRFPWCRSR